MKRTRILPSCFVSLLVALFHCCDAMSLEEAVPEVSLAGLPLDPSLPKFEQSQDSVVVASRWQQEVYMPCRIVNLDEEQTVTWIRKRDSLILTIDKLKLIDDPRFRLSHSDHDWTLILAQPDSLDAGLYECQVSSMEPKLSRLVELRMVEASSHISNLSTLFVRPNEQLNLTCSIEAPQKTDFVYWYKNKETIHFDNLKFRPQEKAFTKYSAHRLSQGGQDLVSGQEDRTNDWLRSSSSLVIKQTQLSDTANYTCLPSNARPSHISIIVIENGLQSQPEKRSLQAVDGASTYVSFITESKQLARLLGLKFIASLSHWLDMQEVGFSVVIQEPHKLDEKSIMLQTAKLLSSQDLHRFCLTLFLILYSLRGPL